MSKINIRLLSVAAVMTGALTASTATVAEPIGFAGPFLFQPHRAFEQIRPAPQATAYRDETQVSPHLRRRVVDYPTNEAPGTIVVDTPNTYLYLVLAGGQAIRYGIGVGRDGFTWSGVRTIDRKAEWPDWYPPADMLERQPFLPRMMAGGPGNPMGARAMYLGGTVYRIHGTNSPSTIGTRATSGCIRMVNDDVIDLYTRVNIGTKVVVLPMQPARAPSVARNDRSIPTQARTTVAAGGRVSGLY